MLIDCCRGKVWVKSGDQFILAMLITREAEGGRVTLLISGLITGTTTPKFESELKQTAQEGVKEIEIDLEAVDLICSSGLRVLLQNYKSLKAEDRLLSVVNPSANVRSALEITGFGQIIKDKPAPDGAAVEESVEMAVSGRIDGAKANELEVDLLNAMRTGAKTIQLNMADAEFLCSAGIRVLLQNYRTMKKEGRSLSVTKPSAIVREALETTGFADLIDS